MRIVTAIEVVADQRWAYGPNTAVLGEIVPSVRSSR